eukprot:scaffold86248_cov57-Phaeocystis_antarctica.AAC.4
MRRPPRRARGGRPFDRWPRWMGCGLKLMAARRAEPAAMAVACDARCAVSRHHACRIRQGQRAMCADVVT